MIPVGQRKDLEKILATLFSRTTRRLLASRNRGPASAALSKGRPSTSGACPCDQPNKRLGQAHPGQQGPSRTRPRPCRYFSDTAITCCDRTLGVVDGAKP